MKDINFEDIIKRFRDIAELLSQLQYHVTQSDEFFPPREVFLATQIVKKIMNCKDFFRPNK
jgi:hypothetical protein